jgi:hypothetical protein
MIFYGRAAVIPPFRGVEKTAQLRGFSAFLFLF